MSSPTQDLNLRPRCCCDALQHPPLFGEILLMITVDALKLDLAQSFFFFFCTNKKIL